MNRRHHEQLRNGTTHTLSRRSYLSALFSTSFVASPVPSRDRDDSVVAEELLIRPALLPEEFIRAEEVGNGPLVEALRSADPTFANADFASNGYWAGRGRENPHWVVASGACVADQQVPIETAVNVTARNHEEFINDYDAETPQAWTFDRQVSSRGEYHDWRAQIYVSPTWLEDEPVESASPNFIDTIRMQYRDSVLLWTVLLGPTEGRWPYKQFLTTTAKDQRFRLEV